MMLSALRIPLRVAPLYLRRPLSTKLQNPLLSTRTSSPILSKTAAYFPNHGKLYIRGVASQVSGRPGSQSIEHAATNIKEELGNSSADLARTIAGGNVFQDAVAPTQQTFVRLLRYTNHPRCLTVTSSYSWESRTRLLMPYPCPTLYSVWLVVCPISVPRVQLYIALVRQALRLRACYRILTLGLLLPFWIRR